MQIQKNTDQKLLNLSNNHYPALPKFNITEV
jgi:hypothetical protein